MKVRITNGLLIALLINMVYAKAIGMTQGIMAREVQGDMWLATIFSTLQGILVIWLVAKTMQRLPRMNIIEHHEHLFGKWAGKIVALLCLLFFLGAYGGVMITLVYHLMDYFLPEVPILVFVVAGTLVGLYALYFGLEVIGRLAFVGLFAVAALNILILLGSMHDFDVRELLPLFQSGWINTLLASRHNDTDWGMATITAAMIFNHVKNSDVWTRSGTLGILYGGLTVVLWPILEAGVMSPEVTSQYIVACMQLARTAEIGQFIHRYELIMVIFFSVSALVQVMMSLFCGSLAATHLFGLKDYRPMIIPICLLFGAFAYWVVLDHHRAMYLLSDRWPPFALSIAVGLPVLTFLLGFLRRKKWQPKKASEEQ